MLVLSRKKSEEIIVELPGMPDPLRIMVVEVRGDKARIGIEAPLSVAVHRLEVYEAIQSQKEKGLHESP